MTEDNELIEIVEAAAIGWANSVREQHGLPPCGLDDLTDEARGDYMLHARAALVSALTAYRNHQVEL